MFSSSRCFLVLLLVVPDKRVLRRFVYYTLLEASVCERIKIAKAAGVMPILGVFAYRVYAPAGTIFFALVVSQIR